MGGIPTEWVDPELKRWATAREVDIVDAINETGSGAAAAVKLGINKSNVNRAVARLKKRAARQEDLAARKAKLVPTMEAVEVTDQYGADGELTSFSVRQRPVAEDTLGRPDRPLPGFAYKQISTLYGRDNEKMLEWQIQSPDTARRWLEIEDAIERRVEAVVPREPAPLPAILGPANMLNQVTIADGHVGALAWDTETASGNWDLNIARETLLTGACWLMDSLPPAEELLLMVLGDFLDSDGYAPLTPASKHLLDVDGRYPKIADVGSDVIEAAVAHGLKRYARVRLVIKPGNHDPQSAWWMRKLFTRIFQNEPRVIVEPSIRPYWAMLFGKTMISSHHGDKATLNELPGIFAADFAETWGKATYRICHTGHLHHKHFIIHSGKELRGMMVYQHPTLAARNAWAADKGLAAARELLGHSYHANGAMVTTLHFTPDLLG